MIKDELIWLRRWFVLHFIIDVVVALSLFIAPRATLVLVGIEGNNVVLARIIAAALMAVGIESWIGRNANKKHFLGMLRLKIIWSATVILGLLIGFLTGDVGGWSVNMVMGTFIIFNLIWVYWFMKLVFK